MTDSSKGVPLITSCDKINVTPKKCIYKPLPRILKATNLYLSSEKLDLSSLVYSKALV